MGLLKLISTDQVQSEQHTEIADLSHYTDENATREVENHFLLFFLYFRTFFGQTKLALTSS